MLEYISILEKYNLLSMLLETKSRC